MEFDALSNRVIGCAIEIHQQLGPGLLESVYQRCLAYELTCAGLRIDTEYPVGIRYKDVALDCGFRMDVLVESPIDRGTEGGRCVASDT